ncbi:hypothetical protein PMZ66_00640 [Clostridium paraputrificum]|nr:MULTISPECIES: hypothetical protein [Clostridium]MBS7130146.1 hypothetical protein [Clostridium sp.]MDB2074104.1 hypothetical protein [Clostridium paraputrificum]MDB2078042.1 hypothetical protein [Clostridium paraputrificum]MDB2093171.1 hypothetical protein [Clostridium paraputrificum]MDB2107708.1 hypothetical protein [Clostridium paraputrificum]
MKVNKKMLFGVIALIIFSWGANMIYFMNTRIHDPLFGYTYGDNELALISYFTSDEEDKIERVVFPELGEEEFNIHNMDSYPGSSTSLFYNKLNQEIDDKYKVHYFYIPIWDFSDEYKKELFGGTKVTKLNYNTVKGKEGTIEFGEVKFKDKDLTSLDNNILSFSDSFYDSGYQHTTFILEDDIEITGTDNELFKLYLENGLIQINNKKIDSKSFPIKLKKGEILQVQVGLDNIFPPYYMINGSITFIAKNKEGKEEKINIDVMDSINKEFTKK